MHTRPGGEQYKRYKGPNGQRSQSIRQAWAIHERSSVQAAALPPAVRVRLTLTLPLTPDPGANP